MLKAGTWVSVLVSLLLLGGCASSIEVVPMSETAKKESVDTGIPYYLPAPCVLITKNVTVSTPAKPAEQPKSDKASSPTNQAEQPKVDYKVEVVYLPDLERQYGIKIKQGIGSFSGDITLVDGWKFTGLKVESDSQIDEVLKATTDLIPKIIGGPIFGNTKGVGSTQGAVKPAEKSELWLYRLNKDGTWSLLFHWPDERMPRALK